MSESIRYTVLQQVDTQLKTIQTANGYQTNIGRNVISPVDAMSSDNLPAVLWEVDEEEASALHGSIIVLLPLMVVGVAQAGSDGPLLASEHVLADIVKCMTNPSMTLIGQIEYQSGGYGDLRNNPQSVTVTANFNLKYTITLGDPYTN